MKKLFVTGVAVAGSLIASSSFAADIPAYKGAPAVPYFSWTGFYLGGNVGYGKGSASGTVTALGTTTSLGSENLKGALGGGQVGYNWQSGALLLGIEADLQGTGQKATSSVGTITQKDQISSFGTVRARVGYAADRWLVYGTTGLGYGTFRSDLTVPGLGTDSASSSRSAWVIGAGVEQAFASHWSWKAEYLYLDTGKVADSRTLPGVTFNTQVKDHVFRIGLNYLFN
jgi:outer membrane immunogenic protein